MSNTANEFREINSLLQEDFEKRGLIEKTERRPIDDIYDLSDKYKDKWLNAKVIGVVPSVYGKGFDISVAMKGYDDLPSTIETSMVKKEVKVGQSIKVQLYISAGGILVDKIK